MRVCKDLGLVREVIVHTYYMTSYSHNTAAPHNVAYPAILDSCLGLCRRSCEVVGECGDVGLVRSYLLYDIIRS